MELPFTPEQFLAVFATYNTRLWPFAATLWVLSAAALVTVLSRGRADSAAARLIDRRIYRAIVLLLAIHWAWSALAYHLAFFSGINPAAVPFAVGFLAQAAILLTALENPPRFYHRWTLRHVAGVILAAYSLMYPLVAAITVHSYPEVPTFGVPCPTVLFTIGMLLTAEPLRPLLLIIPLAWGLIGGSAALLLGMTPDYALLIAGAVVLFAVLKEYAASATSTGTGRSP